MEPKGPQRTYIPKGKTKYLYKGPEMIHSKGTQREPILHMLHFISPIKWVHADIALLCSTHWSRKPLLSLYPFELA